MSAAQNADYVRVPIFCPHAHITAWEVREVLPTDPLPEIERCADCEQIDGTGAPDA